MTLNPKVIALYLPQFHPIPENDQWWGPGFTEWTNVAKARPLFKGHVQPKLPADLGFYDLRLEETRIRQAELAHEAGIEGFCYYHYWFDGKQLLERPFNEVLSSGKPDFPFCLCWANHTWSNKTWDRKSAIQGKSVLIEQTYPGKEDDIAHFMSILPALRDKRYIRIDGKPVFFLYDAFRHTHVSEWIKTWRQLAEENGLPGLYLVGMTPSTITYRIRPSVNEKERVLPDLESSAYIYDTILDMGFDAVNSFGKRRGEMLASGKYSAIITSIMRKIGIPVDQRFDYSKTVSGFFAPEDSRENVFPTILPNWDRTPRAATYDGVYVGSTPEAFKKHVRAAFNLLKDKQPEHQIVLLKSWNEWGEGNYIEPDMEFGHGYLDALHDVIDEIRNP